MRNAPCQAWGEAKEIVAIALTITRDYIKPGLLPVVKLLAEDNPTRHHGHVRLGTGVRLRRAEGAMRFEQERVLDRSAPLPARVEDFATDEINNVLTKGGVVRLTGEKLKLDLNDPQQGLFLVKSTGATTRIDKVKTNKPSEQLFVVPTTLAAGTYRLEVRTKHPNSDQLKTATLGAPLTVA